jgi:type I restriction enzyme S subunit
VSPEKLLQQFDVMADAPNGVQKLRELILQLAVRGKLVPQNPADEPAPVLLERIEARLGANSKGPRRMHSRAEAFSALSSIKLPMTWEAVLLGNVLTVQNGFAFDSKEFNESSEGLPLIRIRDLGAGSTAVFYAGDFRNEFLVHTGDYLIGMDGNFELHEWSGPQALLNQRVCRLLDLADQVDRRFVFWMVRVALAEIHGATSFVTVKHLSSKSIQSIRLPLPPLPEQRRIAAKVDELMALCDELEARQQRRVWARTRLNRSALHHLTAATGDAELAEHWQRLRESFDLLYGTPETVAEFRRAVLQLAVRGKLVPFDATSVMHPLGSILAESSLNGISTKPSDVPIGTPILRISAGTSRQDALVDELDFKYLRIDAGTIDKFRLVAGDLLACRFNGNLHYVGRLSLYTGCTATTQVYPDKLIRFRVNRERADPAYVRYAFNAPETRQKIEAFCATTAGNIGISAGQLKNIDIPVPSLGTQHRIVAKVDQLMALCDQMEARLTLAGTKSEQLAASVVHHVSAA